MTDTYARYTRLKFDRPHARVLRITMENGRMNTTDEALHRELAEIWRVRAATARDGADG